MRLPFKIKEREKRFLIMGGLVVLAILMFEGYSRYNDYKKMADDTSGTQIVMLEKQLSRISQKDEVEKRLAVLKAELETQEKGVLEGDKPPVAAATLSRVLREAALSNGVNIALERTLNPFDVHQYTAVPIEIGFTTTTEKLKELLYKLRISQYIINISEIKVRVTNISNPADIYTSMVATGFIKKPAPVKKETPQEKQADETGAANDT